MALVISADEIKKNLPNYSPEKAEFFHRESAKLADKNFEIAIDLQMTESDIITTINKKLYE